MVGSSITADDMLAMLHEGETTHRITVPAVECDPPTMHQYHRGEIVAAARETCFGHIPVTYGLTWHLPRVACLALAVAMSITLRGLLGSAVQQLIVAGLSMLLPASWSFVLRATACVVGWALTYRSCKRS